MSGPTNPLRGGKPTLRRHVVEESRLARRRCVVLLRCGGATGGSSWPDVVVGRLASGADASNGLRYPAIDDAPSRVGVVA